MDLLGIISITDAPDTYTQKKDPQEAVAFKFHMEHDQEEIGFCIRILWTDKAVWIYDDGSVQEGMWTPEVADVLFHEGDTIEITF